MTNRFLLFSMPSNPKSDTIISPRQMHLFSYHRQIPARLTCLCRISTLSYPSMRQALLYSFYQAFSTTAANYSIWKPSLPLRRHVASLLVGILRMLLATFPCSCTIGMLTLPSGARINTSMPERVLRAGCLCTNATAE